MAARRFTSQNMLVNRISISRVYNRFSRNFSTGNQWRNENGNSIDQKLLEILVCPLSKKPLRYESATNELISDEIGVAFPIENSIPNLIPHDGRLLKRDDTTSSKTE